MCSERANTASLTISNLDPALKEQLRVRAAQHGHSMEAEVRGILQSALNGVIRTNERNLYEWIRARFEPFGGVDLDLPPHDPVRSAPQLA